VKLLDVDLLRPATRLVVDDVEAVGVLVDAVYAAMSAERLMGVSI
jgi:hypothetical protein